MTAVVQSLGPIPVPLSEVKISHPFRYRPSIVLSLSLGVSGWDCFCGYGNAIATLALQYNCGFNSFRAAVFKGLHWLWEELVRKIPKNRPFFGILSASNPGPPKHSPWTLGVCNPSGLNGKQQIINDHLGFGDTWLFAETHLSSSAMQSFKAGLCATDSPYRYCVGGQPCPLRPHSEHVGSWSGVSVLSKRPTRAIPVKIDPDLFQSSRIQVTATLCHDLWISGAIIYGEPAGVLHPHAASHTDALVHAALDAIAAMPGFRFVGGDFNFECGLECFERLEQLGFQDLQTLAESHWGLTPQPTCKGSTRKDFLYISPELQQLLVDVKVIHDVWADHSVVVGYFQGHNADIETPVWRVPQPIEWPSDFKLKHPLSISFENDDPTGAYAELWSVIEAEAIAQTQGTSVQLRRAQLGRGRTFDTHIRKGMPPPRHLKPSRKGDVQPQYEGTSAQHSNWFRQLRRLQAYCRFKKVHGVDTDNAHGAALWRSILCAKGFQNGFPFWWVNHCETRLHGAPGHIPLVPPSFEIAELIFASMNHEVRSLEARLRTVHQSKMRKQRTELAHMVFRDCQAVSPDRVDVLIRHRQSVVVEVDHDEQTIKIDPTENFEKDQKCFIAGREAWILNADPDLLHLDNVDLVEPGQTVVQTPLTGKLDDLFKAFGDEWSARWNRHLQVPPSQWDQILAFSQHHLPSKSFDPPHITSSCISTELKRKKSRSSSGPDGVSLSDLRAMPSEVLEAHAAIFCRSEVDGCWPEQVLVGRVASLAKSSSPSQVRDFRPITVLSHCYRLWGGLRSRQLLRHVDDLCPSLLFGNRPGCHAMQLWTFVQWMIEMAHYHNHALAGVSADIQKAFNHIPREVMFHACLLLGMPAGVLKAWAGALANIQRRFQIRDAMSPPHFSVTGCPEGCSMSCLGMLVIDILFHKWMSVQFPLEFPLSYVDDWQILTHQPDHISAILESLDNFTRSVDLQLDSKKTFAWCTCQTGRKFLRQQHISLQHQAKNLGVQMQFTRRPAAKVLTSRLNDLQSLWPRLRRSLSPYKVKVQAIVAAAWPRGLHGVSATSVSSAQLTTARAGAMKALQANGAGCNPMVQLGMIESPMADPSFWTIMETFRCVRDSHSHVALAPLVHAALESQSPLPRSGPTRALVSRIHRLGWRIDDQMMLQDDLGKFDLFSIPHNELLMRAERSWIRVIAAGVVDRPIFQGLEQADSRDTRVFLKSLDQQDQAIFRKSLNGAHFTNDALCYFSSSGSSMCTFCMQSKDSRYHRYWECPVFEPQRKECPPEVLDLVPSLPCCLTLAGWSLAPSLRAEWESALLALSQPEVPPLPNSVAPGSWINLFSDGSCFWPASRGYNVASWAVTLAPPDLDLHNSLVITAGPLPGLTQTAFRSEVFGALQAIRFGSHHTIKVRLWTDCLGVVNRLNEILQHKPLKPSVPHFDLWTCVVEELERLGHCNFTVSKVAAHQTIDDAEGPLEQWAYLHNSLVDRAARLANMCRDQDFWSLHSRYAQSVESTRFVNRSVQQVLLAIGRSAVVRENGKTEDTCQVDVHQASRTKLPEVPSGYHLTLPATLSGDATGKFGFRLTSLVFAWLQQALAQADGSPRAWISFYQLYVDFQCATGDSGPVYMNGWVDPKFRPNVLLQPFDFKKRCMWFTKLFKHVAKQGGSQLFLATARPDSISLQLHAPVISINWSRDRLQWIEAWFGRHLKQAATREGHGLKTIPLAKRDGRWSKVVLPEKPLRF